MEWLVITFFFFWNYYVFSERHIGFEFGERMKRKLGKKIRKTEWRYLNCKVFEVEAEIYNFQFCLALLDLLLLLADPHSICSGLLLR